MNKNLNNIKYIGVHGEIYKNMNEYWLKVSPWTNNEDRRKKWPNLILNKGKYFTIKTKDINRILNEKFNSFMDSWEHNGEKFFTKPYNTLADNLQESEKPKPHIFNGMPFYLIYRHGNIYWTRPYKDKYILFEFRGIDKMPIQGLGFYSSNGLKPIYKIIPEGFDQYETI